MRLQPSALEEDQLALWWRTIDRALFATILVIMGLGLVLSLAASPAIAMKRGLPALYFFHRQAVFVLFGAALMTVLSMLTPAAIRRVCLAVLAVALGLMVVVLVAGPEINGARRWIRLLGYSFQPSEVAKPAFVVLVAWLFAEAELKPAMPARAMATALLVLMVGLLALEPDIGQAILVTALWGAIFLVSGMPLTWGAGLAASAIVGVGGAYLAFGHVRDRVDRFLDPTSGDNYQMERALQAIREGGLMGRGPGEGTVKTVLPDAHTDFILAVIAEEYGAIACLVLIGLFALVVLKGLARALSAPGPFERNAIIGLVLLLALQALINMAVNAGLVPAKGMTLPFVSYGGSSLIALSFGMGLMLALSRQGRSARRRPKNSPFLASGAGAAGTGRWPT
jgi:cell division protein FtsW